LKEGKIYVLKYEELRVEMIQLYYDIIVAGYGGRWKTMELVTRNYWCPGVTRDVWGYVNSCDMCQKMKNWMEILAGKLKLSEISKKL